VETWLREKPWWGLTHKDYTLLKVLQKGKAHAFGLTTQSSLLKRGSLPIRIITKGLQIV